MTSVNDMPADIVEVADRAMDEAGSILDGVTIEQAMSEIGHIRNVYRDSIARAILAERQRDHWQDIATAPKDGTKFLAFEIGEHFNCWWHDNGYGEQYWMDEADSEPNPTHWKPLPAPPKGGAA